VPKTRRGSKQSGHLHEAMLLRFVLVAAALVEGFGEEFGRAEKTFAETDDFLFEYGTEAGTEAGEEDLQLYYDERALVEGSEEDTLGLGTTWTYRNSALSSGNSLSNGTYLVADAKSYCAKRDQCQGFTYYGNTSDPGTQVQCYFKTALDFNGDTRYSSFLKDVPPPTPPPPPSPGGHTYKYYNSALNNGNDVVPSLYGVFTISEAEDVCSKSDQCKAFTYRAAVSDPGGAVPCFFKTALGMNGNKDWSAYVEDAPPGVPTPALPTPSPASPTPPPTPLPPVFPYTQGDVFVAALCDANDPAQIWLKNFTGESYNKLPLMALTNVAATKENTDNGETSYATRWSLCVDCGQCSEGVMPHVWPCQPPFATDQKWLSNGTQGQLQHEADHGLCMSVKNSQNGLPLDVVMAKCDTTTPSQYWYFPSDGPGQVKIKPFGSTGQQLCLSIKGRYHPFPIDSNLKLTYCNPKSPSQKWVLPGGQAGASGLLAMNQSLGKYSQGECIDCTGDCKSGDFPSVQECCGPDDMCPDQTWRYAGGTTDGTPIVSGKNSNLLLQPSSNKDGAVVAMYPIDPVSGQGRDSERWVYNPSTLQFVSALNPMPADPLCLQGLLGSSVSPSGMPLGVCCRASCVLPNSTTPGCTTQCDGPNPDVNCCSNIIAQAMDSCNSVSAPCSMNIPGVTGSVFCLDISPPVPPAPTPVPPTPPPTPPTQPPTPAPPTPPPSAGMCSGLSGIYDCPNNDLYEIPVSGIDDCCYQCMDLRPKCAYWTYDPSTKPSGTCYLKTACPNPRPQCDIGHGNINCTSGSIPVDPTPPPVPPTPPPPTPPPTPAPPTPAPIVCPWGYEGFDGWCWQMHSRGACRLIANTDITVNNKAHTPSHPGAIPNVPTETQCQDICTGDNDCVAWVYDKINSNCFIFAKFEDTKQRAGYVFGTHCPNGTSSLTYPEAETLCNSRGAILARMNSTEQNTFAGSKLQGETPYDWAWFGAQCLNQQWMWVDGGDPVIHDGGFTNFDAGTPGAPGSNTSCATGECLNVGGAGNLVKWHSGKCLSTDLQDGICLRKPLPPVPPVPVPTPLPVPTPPPTPATPTPVPLTNCVWGYEYFGGWCWQLQSRGNCEVVEDMDVTSGTLTGNNPAPLFNIPSEDICKAKCRDDEQCIAWVYQRSYTQSVTKKAVHSLGKICYIWATFVDTKPSANFSFGTHCPNGTDTSLTYRSHTHQPSPRLTLLSHALRPPLSSAHTTHHSHSLRPLLLLTPRSPPPPHSNVQPGADQVCCAWRKSCSTEQLRSK
jgi:hypothetical protein